MVIVSAALFFLVLLFLCYLFLEILINFCQIRVYLESFVSLVPRGKSPLRAARSFWPVRRLGPLEFPNSALAASDNENSPSDAPSRRGGYPGNCARLATETSLFGTKLSVFTITGGGCLWTKSGRTPLRGEARPCLLHCLLFHPEAHIGDHLLGFLGSLPGGR
jgi:hypothetical protein